LQPVSGVIQSKSIVLSPNLQVIYWISISGIF